MMSNDVYIVYFIHLNNVTKETQNIWYLLQTMYLILLPYLSTYCFSKKKSQYVYSIQYVYFFKGCILPVRLFRPVPLLSTLEY